MTREDITAESVIEYAKENGIIIERGAVYWEYPRLCAANVVLHMFVGDDMLRESLSGRPTRYDCNDDRVPFTSDEFRLIESGFEDFDVDSPDEKDDPLYLMGQRIAYLCGVSS